MNPVEKKEKEQDFVEESQQPEEEKKVGSTVHSAAFGAGKFAPGTELRIATEKRLKRKLDLRFIILVRRQLNNDKR